MCQCANVMMDNANIATLFIVTLPHCHIVYCHIVTLPHCLLLIVTLPHCLLAHCLLSYRFISPTFKFNLK